MRLTSSSITPGEPIPAKFAMGKPHPDTHATFSDNINPALAWDDVPPGTRSFAIVVHDRDVPTVGDDVNQEGKTVPADLPRTDFFHWIMIDIDPSRREIAEGEFSNGVSARGKEGPQHSSGARHGINSYTGWFAGDPDMGGDYFGYDGPFPPWNDSVTHNYTFTIYALDVDRLDIDGAFDGPAVLAALNGHVLDSASFEATYRIAD